TPGPLPHQPTGNGESEMEASTAELQRLIDNGFEGAPILDQEGYPAVLVYMRRWSSGTIDVVTVLGEREAAAYRASDVDPLRLDDLDGDIVRWRTVGTVRDVAAEVLELPAPGGVPISAQTAE